jgi:hypothetical protein
MYIRSVRHGRLQASPWLRAADRHFSWPGAQEINWRNTDLCGPRDQGPALLGEILYICLTAHSTDFTCVKKPKALPVTGRLGP